MWILKLQKTHPLSKYHSEPTDLEPFLRFRILIHRTSSGSTHFLKLLLIKPSFFLSSSFRASRQKEILLASLLVRHTTLITSLPFFFILIIPTTNLPQLPSNTSSPNIPQLNSSIRDLTLLTTFFDLLDNDSHHLSSLFKFLQITKLTSIL